MPKSRAGRPCGSASSLAGAERLGLSGGRCGRPARFACGPEPEPSDAYKESGGSERSRKQHKPHQQLSAQSQVSPALKDRFQNAAYPCEMNRLPPVMRGLKKLPESLWDDDE